MQENTTDYLHIKKQNKHLRYVFRDIAVCLSFFVVLSVFWYLKLTGITLAGEAFCGIDEHTHNEECSISTLICTEPARSEHIHGDSCYTVDQICTLEESEGHIHSDECYDLSFVCGSEDDGSHVHIEECRSAELICELEESGGHTHTEE
ncbi:MAG: hypothetical protein IKU19_07050, partial [Clostridia bacterium]|nr:hypothetical protein [Clostridia bacterium]